MKTQKPPTYLFNAVDQELSKIEKRLAKLENEKLPTFPRRPPEQLFPVGVLSQLVVGDDDQMYSYTGVEWRNCNVTL